MSLSFAELNFCVHFLDLNRIDDSEIVDYLQQEQAFFQYALQFYRNNQNIEVNNLNQPNFNEFKQFCLSNIGISSHSASMIDSLKNQFDHMMHPDQ